MASDFKDALDNDETAKTLLDKVSDTDSGFVLNNEGLLLYKDHYYVPDTHDLRLRITKEHHDPKTAGHPGR